MAKGFGNTWWGSRWLLSLTHIDYENRIPRGATYARAGAVREIKIKGNVISAKVKGRRPRAYSVTIIVPPFFPEDVEKLLQGIMERPDIVSKLLKHELDPEVMYIASECGLSIFPENAGSANSATRNSATSSGRSLLHALYACSFSERSARLMAGMRSSSARF